MAGMLDRLRSSGKLGIARIVLVSVALVSLLLVPLSGNDYWLRILTFIFMFAIMAEGWNVIGGLTGYTAFGQVAWFGMGAYSVAIGMTKWKLSFWPSLGLACLVPTVAAAIIGLGILRLRGHYFAISTLALGIAMGELIKNLDYFGGASGLSLPIGPSFTYFYYLMLAGMILSVLAVWAISRSRFGYALYAIRENETAASTLGINTTYYKTTAYAISALLTGLAGGIYAYWTSFIDAPTVFSIVFNVDMVVMVVLGGAGTIFGPVIGAFILEGLNEVLGSTFLELHAIIFGAVIVLIVLFMPEGLSGLVSQGRFSVRKFVSNLKTYKV